EALLRPLEPERRLRNPEIPLEERGFVDGEVHLCAELRERLESRAQNLDGVRLFDLAEDDDLAAAEREVYRQELYVRVDAVIEESEGRRPPANASVHEMIEEAYRRLGQRDLEERSLTTWLRLHAPEIAA